MKDLKALVLVAEEQEVVKHALQDYWNQCQGTVSSYKDMLAGRERIPQGLTREQVQAALTKWEEKCVNIHNLLNRVEK